MFAAQLESAILGADLHQLDHLSRVSDLEEGD
jgi:hypothetical protein